MKLQRTLPISLNFSLVLLLKYWAYSGVSQGVKQEAHQMVKGLLNTVNRTLSHEDVGKLLLRLAVGGLMLFHGLHKLLDGVDGISGMLVAKGWPGFIAYGVLVGEVVAPCLLIVGILTRPAALVLAFTMVVAWLMVGLGKTFALDAVGAWAIENLVYFFVGALAIALLGAGRYSLAGQSAWR
jgi:putative oxidoreductase